jgi:hypothetical protein
MKLSALGVAAVFCLWIACPPLHADWQWKNDLATATSSPRGYEAQFTFQNNGKDSITATGLTFSCSCIRYHFQATSAKAGKTGTLTIQILRNGDDDPISDVEVMVIGSAGTTSQELTLRFAKSDPVP